MIWYGIVFPAALFLSIFSTAGVIFFIRRWGLRWNLIDKAAYRKRGVIAGLGGISIYLTVWLVGWGVYFWGPDLMPGFHGHWVGLFLATTLMLMLGIADDLRKLGYRIKFSVQILSAALLYYFGFRIELITDPFRMVSISLGYFSFPVTLFWHLLILNAVNLIDGLDGLAAGVAIIAFFVIAAATQFAPTIGNLLCVALVGALVGFLPYNFFPAKIFLGDAGSQLLGQFVSAITLFSTMKSTASIALSVPIAILIIPTINTILIALVRLSRGKNPFESQTGFHLHYKLIRLGFSHRESVLILYLASLVFGALALWAVSKASPALSFWMMILSTLAVTGAYFGIRRHRRTLRPERTGA